MNSDRRIPSVTLDNLLKQLSDEEVVSVSSAENSALLNDGEAYLDLEHLEQGVRRAKGKSTPMGRVLPKKAVNEKTWNKIMAQLASPPSVGMPSTP